MSPRANNKKSKLLKIESELNVAVRALSALSREGLNKRRTNFADAKLLSLKMLSFKRFTTCAKEQCVTSLLAWALRTFKKNIHMNPHNKRRQLTQKVANYTR